MSKCALHGICDHARLNYVPANKSSNLSGPQTQAMTHHLHAKDAILEMR